ncbi:hypothetical protein LCGC14_0364060 [marine sediment metagenome]|uniref:Portal protein n=1 Tax=marine sediment metagenome TaxID=412755 RepID=A0A0F9TQ39_9ZZZZ
MAINLSNIKEVKELKNDMVSFYGQLHTAMLEDENFHDLNIEHLLALPQKFANQGVVLPTAREVVETAVDHISPTNRRIDVPRRSGSRGAAEQSKLLRRFYGALLTFLEQGPPVSPYREITKHLSVWGISTAKFVYDENKWKDEPPPGSSQSLREDWRNFQATTMPFTLQILHPSEVLFDPWHDPPEWAIQVSKKMVGELESTYPEWGNPRNLKKTTKVDMFEFWSDLQRSVIIGGQPGLGDEIVEHGWGTHPFIIGSSGLGIDGSEHQPEKRFVGLLRYLKGILLSESRNYSIADIVMKTGAWPVRMLEGERANEVPALTLEFGTLQPMPPGVKVVDINPSLPPSEVFQHLSLANNIISAAAAPRVVRGGQNPGTRAGFQQQLAIGEARLRYAPLAEATERMMTMMCVKAGIYMEKIVPGPVSLGPGATQEEFKSIKGSNFGGHHSVKVKVNVLAPEDEIRKQQGAINLVAAGLQSPQMAIETLFPQVDSNSELGRILAARIMFGPQLTALVSAAVVEKVADEAGLEEVLTRMLEEAEAEVQGGGRATRQPPAGPEGALTGSLEDQGQQRVQAGVAGANGENL